MDDLALKQDLSQYLYKNNIWLSWERLDYFLSLHFRGLALDSHSVIEIGAGPGFYSAWCAANGASKVVALEPEADGSNSGVAEEFSRLAKTINLNRRVEYLPISFQAYLAEHRKECFDYVLMHAVINHIDENATKKLHVKAANAERQSYKNVFDSIYNIMNGDGVLLIYDVGRRNFWHDLKLKNPFAKTIEYEKHQQPSVWKHLLEESGFKFVDLIWPVIFKFRKFSSIFSWWLPSYLTNSGFILRCRK